MHNGGVVHAPLGPHIWRQPVLSMVSMARSEGDDKRGTFEKGKGWAENDGCSTYSILFLFFTFILARGCFYSLTHCFDRRHPLPLGLLN